MWKDPIVEEIRKYRDQYAGRFNHNIDEIFKDLQQRQTRSRQKPITLSPRKPIKTVTAA